MQCNGATLTPTAAAAVEWWMLLLLHFDKHLVDFLFFTIPSSPVSIHDSPITLPHHLD